MIVIKCIRKMPMTKEERKETSRIRVAEWRKNNPKRTNEAKKKYSWKKQGIIDGDYDALYEYLLNEKNCMICLKEYKNNSDKQVDHDHSITDDENIRYICCLRCNTTFLKEKNREDNTSGHIGISWVKRRKCWRVRWQVDGKEQCKYFKDKNDAIEFNNTIDRS